MPMRGAPRAPSRPSSRPRSSRWRRRRPCRKIRRKDRDRRRMPPRWRRSRRPTPFLIPDVRSICRKPRCARKLRFPPISALPSGWCGSGPTISASRPTGSRACPAPMSAKPFAQMRSAASSISCWPSRVIRRCCSISTILARWARTRRPASTAAAASTRTLRARSWSCIRSACVPATPRTTSSASPMC